MEDFTKWLPLFNFAVAAVALSVSWRVYSRQKHLSTGKLTLTLNPPLPVWQDISILEVAGVRYGTMPVVITKHLVKLDYFGPTVCVREYGCQTLDQHGYVLHDAFPLPSILLSLKSQNRKLKRLPKSIKMIYQASTGEKYKSNRYKLNLSVEQWQAIVNEHNKRERTIPNHPANLVEIADVVSQ